MAVPWDWLAFAAAITFLLVLDLNFHGGGGRSETLARAAWWSALYVGAGLAFALFVAVTHGGQRALEYLTAFLIEKALSVDNLFVFVALFSYFGVKREHQHRVLFWGILGAIVMRGLFIGAGVALLNRFDWLVYVLGVLLLVTGAKLAVSGAEEVHPERNLLVRWASRFLPIERAYHGQRFTVPGARGIRFTPLILVLVAIESTDLMFAVDSVPAVLAVSSDVFVVYTSNVFAVLGLRALYSLLANLLGALRFLKPALALILVLVGVKMLISGYVHVPVAASLAAVAAILAAGTVISLIWPDRENPTSGDPAS